MAPWDDAWNGVTGAARDVGNGIGGAVNDTVTFVQETAETIQGGIHAATGERAHIGGGCEYFNSDPMNMGPWMLNVGDNVPVTRLFIPGAHDAVALYGGIHAQCQSWTITEQLWSGIRALDLRFRMVGDAMCGHHGAVYQKINFGDVASQIEDFLNQNPSEVVFVRISGAGCSHDSDCSFPDLLEHKISHRGRDTVLWQLMQDLGNATLGQLRGKIVAFDGVMCCNFPDDKQDEYEIGNPNDKWAQVLSHANKKRAKGVIHLNYMNSQGHHAATWYSPDRMAKKINEKAMGHIKKHFNPGFYMMDYPGVALVKEFIDENMK